jgi:HEAT repeat protein
MRKRIQIALAVLLMAIAGVIGWQVLREREPVYAGKHVSYWIARSGEYYEGSSFNRIGGFPGADSNAIPYLVRVLQRQDGLFGQAYRGRWIRLPYRIQRVLPRPVDAEQMRFSAAMSFGNLGDVARPAIPALLRALRDDKSEDVRGWSAWSLGRLGKAERTVISALTEALNDKAPFVRSQAADALVLSSAAARNAVASLVKCMDDKNRDVRVSATNALKAIDPEAAAKAGVE